MWQNVAFLSRLFSPQRVIIRRMSKEYSVIIEKDSDGFFVASVPDLSGVHTQAKSMDELLIRVKEAIELALEEQEQEVLDGIPSQFIGIQRVCV